MLVAQQFHPRRLAISDDLHISGSSLLNLRGVTSLFGQDSSLSMVLPMGISFLNFDQSLETLLRV